MGTDKRERQKANRQQRLEELAKEQQREKTKRRALQIGGLIAAVVVVALLFAIFGGNDEASTDATTDTTLGLDNSIVTTAASTASTMAPQPTVSAATLTGETPCPDAASPRTITFAQAPPMCIDPSKQYSATIKVALNGEESDLTIELDPAAAPITVNNFVVLARYHYFDGIVCHRAIPEFVVQCGDPDGTGRGGPGYEFDDELPADLSAYVKGAVAMANAGPNTNGSQFFFVTGDSAGVKFGAPNYTLFGQVTEGLGLDRRRHGGLRDRIRRLRVVSSRSSR